MKPCGLRLEPKGTWASKYAERSASFSASREVVVVGPGRGEPREELVQLALEARGEVPRSSPAPHLFVYLATDVVEVRAVVLAAIRVGVVGHAVSSLGSSFESCRPGRWAPIN